MGFQSRVQLRRYPLHPPDARERPVGRREGVGDKEDAEHAQQVEALVGKLIGKGGHRKRGAVAVAVSRR